MRIGIDLQVLAQKPWTGIGKYAYHLAKALIELKSNHEFVFFVPKGLSLRGPRTQCGGRSNPDEIAALPFDKLRVARNDNIEVVSLPKKSVPFWSSHVSYARIMREADLDVLHGPANVFPLWPINGQATKRKGSPPIYRHIKKVLTIHDLAIYRHPEWFARGQWFSTKVVVPRSIKKADHIIVPSEATKKDVMEIFGMREEKISVVAHGVEERFFRTATPPHEEGLGEVIGNTATMTPSSSPPHEGEKISSDYILFVGTLEPRKNVSRLIEAYKALPKDILEEYDLVIAGSKGWNNAPQPPLKVRGGEGELWNKIKFLDYVPDDQLPALYQNASLFVYPSLYEGFGMPVLEAMAAGTPTICGRQIVGNFQFPISNLPIEIVDPYSVEEIRDAIIKLSRDAAYLSQISAAGQKLARQFTWEACARRTLEVYEKL